MTTRDDRIRRLKELAGEPPSPAGAAEIQKALGTTHNHVVAAAAGAAGAWGNDSFAPASFAAHLLAAYERFMESPVKSDPACAAKLAIVEALHKMERAEYALYLRGAKHVQFEPVFGGQEDTAPVLRVRSAQALAELGYADADFILVDLLNDREPAARRGAVQIAGARGGRTDAIMLRMAALSETKEPEVAGSSLEWLMKLDPRGSLEFVKRFLRDRRPEVIEAAALALGESRLPEAFDLLLQGWEESLHDHIRELYILPMAVHRSEESFAHLLGVVRDERTVLAVRAVDSLGIFRSDDARAAKVREAARGRVETEVARAVEETFGGG